LTVIGAAPIEAEHTQKCAELARRGLEHAAGDALVMAYCGSTLIHATKDYDWGVAVIRSALEANPNSSTVVTFAAVANLHCGDVGEARSLLERAMRLSPRDPRAHFALTAVAHVEMIRANYAEALVWAGRSRALRPNYPCNLWILIAANAHLGRMGDARRFLAELKKVSPGITVSRIWSGQPQMDPSRCAAILDGLRLAGLPEEPAPEPIIPSLAVLPFQNMSGDPEQEYFADGIADDIITALSRFKSFAVIARNSSFTYKGHAVDVRQVAKDLGVRYVLEGSVRRAGGRLRITAQLVDGASGAHLWARNFDGALDDVFEFQDRITEAVATVVEPQIQAAEIERSRMERPGSIAAYDLFLRAYPKLFTQFARDNGDAYALLSEGLALEPDNARLLAHAAWALGIRHLMGWPPIGPDDVQKCTELSRRSLQHCAGDATVMAICGTTLLHAAKDYEMGMAVIQSAVEANPNCFGVITEAGVAHLHCGRVEDAITCFHRINRLNPCDPLAHVPLAGLAHAQMILGDYAEALKWANRASAVGTSFGPTQWMLIAANAKLGRMVEARRHLEALKKNAPGVTIASIWAGQPQMDPDRMANILDGLRLAGLE